MNLPSITQLKQFFRQTFYIGLLISLTVFAWLRIIFFEVPFSIVEDSTNLVKTVLFGWFLIMAIKAAWLLLLQVGTRVEARLGERRARLRSDEVAVRVTEVIGYSNTLSAATAVSA